MNAEEKLDIDYHLKQYTGYIVPENTETAAYFRHQALQTHSIVIKDALHKALTAAVISTQTQNLQEQARYYLLYGVVRRLRMIRVSCVDILSGVATDRTEPLASDEAAAFEHDLNIIYINIRGVLDNYAWCLFHQTATDKTRKLPAAKVGLFSNEFMADVNLANLKSKLSGFSTWNAELKARRDPVAHRIPLSVPPTHLNNPEEVAQYKALETQILADKSEEERDVLNAQQRKIGTFVPWFVHHPDEGLTAIYPTVPQDIANLIKIVKLVHDILDEARTDN